MMSHVSTFWSETNRYHDLAETFERGIERTHPKAVTSDGVGHRFIHYDVWNATAVDYYEYRGESVKSL